MLYSFDDSHIGLTETNVSLRDRLIPRPKGLSNADWYAFAAETCRLLNAAPADTLDGNGGCNLIIRCEAPAVAETVEQVITGATGIRFDGSDDEHYDNYTDAVRYLSPAKGVATVIAEESD